MTATTASAWLLARPLSAAFVHLRRAADMAAAAGVPVRQKGVKYARVTVSTDDLVNRK